MGNTFSCLGKTKVSRGEHPFQNRIIVEELCRYLSFQDLKQCRLVNSLWEEVATPLLTPNCSPVKLLGISAVQELNSLLSPCFPCTTFILDCHVSGVQNDGEPGFPEAISFLKNVSPWITELHLGESVAHFGAIMPLEELSSSDTFPSLQILGVTLTDENPRADGRMPLKREPLDQLFQELGVHAPNPEMVKFFASLKPVVFLLDSAPNLTQVHLTTRDNWEYFVVFMTILKHYEGRLHITQFQWRGRPQGRCLLPLLNLLLAERELLKLHSLAVEMDFYYQDYHPSLPRLLFSLLQSQQRTLETLGIKGGSLRTDHYCLPLMMPKISSLELQNRCMCFYHITGERFPALRRVTLFTWPLERCHAIGHGSGAGILFPVDTVEELRLVVRYDETSPALFLQISQRFPRVKKLSVTIQEDVVTDICQVEWPCLEHLTLVSKRCEVILDEVIEKASSHQLFKQLKVLAISCERVNPYANTHLSDSSGRLLLKLKNLTCLDLRGCKGKKILKLSWIMIRRMRNKFTVML